MLLGLKNGCFQTWPHIVNFQEYNVPSLSLINVAMMTIVTKMNGVKTMNILTHAISNNKRNILSALYIQQMISSVRSLIFRA